MVRVSRFLEPVLLRLADGRHADRHAAAGLRRRQVEAWQAPLAVAASMSASGCPSLILFGSAFSSVHLCRPTQQETSA
jgi:hypothetical protein